MSKALKNFRLGAEMIRRGADLTHLSAPLLKDLAKRKLASKAEGQVAKPASRKAAAAAKSRGAAE